MNLLLLDGETDSIIEICSTASHAQSSHISHLLRGFQQFNMHNLELKNMHVERIYYKENHSEGIQFRLRIGMMV